MSSPQAFSVSVQLAATTPLNPEQYVITTYKISKKWHKFLAAVAYPLFYEKAIRVLLDSASISIEFNSSAARCLTLRREEGTSHAYS
jgi:hypothetical protein